MSPILKRISVAAWVLALAGGVGCAPGLPGVQGSPATSPAAAAPWAPAVSPSERRAPMAAVAPIEPPKAPLTLEDLVDAALRTSPVTRAAWAQARAAAATYGAERGAWFPTISGEFDATRLKTAGTQGRVAVSQTVYGPTVSLTWLLFGFGRGPAITAAREGLIQANWTHNAAIQDVVLGVGRSYYQYSSLRSLVLASRTSLAEAETNLGAAEERRRVGVATISDVLQARTAVEQARLVLEQTEGDLAAAQGGLAVAVGFPVAAAFEIDTLSDSAPIGRVSAEVDSLIRAARAGRPDLAASEAAVAQARAQARIAAAARMPALTASASTGRSYLNTVTGGRNTYSAAIGFSLPLFNGFTWEFDARAARARADAVEARAEQLARTADLEVYTAYYALRTATERVRTADALLAAADQSAAAARGRYRAGVGSLLELVTAENVLAGARAQRIQTRFAWRTSLLQLAHDSGLLEPGGRPRIAVIPDSSR